MINQPNPENGFANHRVHETLIYPLTSQLDIVVGSWPAGSTSLKPVLLTTLRVKYDAWLPEHLDTLEQTINEHPDWAGLTPLKPNTHCVFNVNSRQWEDPRSLDDLKTSQWASIKKARSRAEYTGFVWDGSTFDSDTLSQQRITGAVTLAQMSAEFAIDWTLQDNTVRTLNQAEMLTVGMLLGVHVQTQFAIAQALRALIDAATTHADVEAVTWPGASQ